MPQNPVSDQTSSGSRLRVLSEAYAGLGSPPILRAEQLHSLLASHRAMREPYSPCRHPGHGSSGQTLASVLFDLGEGSFTLYQGNPCDAPQRRLRPPSRARAS